MLISDEFTDPIIQAFLAAPAEMSPIAAYRHAVSEVFLTMAGEEYDYAIARQRLMYTLPEAKGALYDEYIRTIRLLTEACANRLGYAEDDSRMRVTAGAMVGVMMAAADDAPMSGTALLEALEILEDGASPSESTVSDADRP